MTASAPAAALHPPATSSSVASRRLDIGPDHRAIIIEREADCDAIAGDWTDLAANAAEPNVFYEPWQLRPAWRTFGGLDAVLALYRRGRTKADAPTLIGLFPTTFASSPSSWLGTRAELWTHPYGFLRTPLVRRGCCLEAVDLWTRAVRALRPDVSLALWERMHAEGPVAQALVDWSRQTGSRRVVTQGYSRAVCEPQPDTDADAYIEHAISKKQRRELARQRRRLEEIGTVTTHRPLTADEAAAFAETFLTLEAAGWKGSSETAIAADSAHADYFRRLIAEAHERGQLDASELRLDERPIAVKLSFESAGQPSRRIGFACKIGYDETLAKFSPGVLLELETIHRMHADDAPSRIDSCAAPNHPMIDRLWSERVAMQHVAFALPGASRLARARLSLLAARSVPKPLPQSAGVLRANY